MALIVMLVLLWGQLRSLPSHIVSLLWTKHRWSVLHILTHLNSQQPYETDQNIPIVSMRTQRHREGRSPAQANGQDLNPALEPTAVEPHCVACQKHFLSVHNSVPRMVPSASCTSTCLVLMRTPCPACTVRRCWIQRMRPDSAFHYSSLASVKCQATFFIIDQNPKVTVCFFRVSHG